MTDQPDVVIRGGTVIDGSGGDPVEADVAIRGGVIQAVGRDLPRGAEEIDARGRIVTPGVRRSRMNAVIPRCFGASGFVRQRTSP